MLPNVDKLLLMSLGETQTLDSVINTSSPRYLSADSETGICYAMYQP